MSGLASKLSWHANRWACGHLHLLNMIGATLSVVSMFRSPGDTLLAAMLCRIIKEKHPSLRINCCVEYPDLLRYDPWIDTLNATPERWQLYFEYLGLIEHRDGTQNLLQPVLNSVNISDYRYKSEVYLTQDELHQARLLIGALDRPMITVNVMSRETVKIWKLAYWRALLDQLCRDYTVIQLGDKTEPFFPDVTSFAGKLSLRESMAVLAHAEAHIGPDSFLMHAANGLNVPSVIIFGGARTSRNGGYDENENLYEAVDCSPCWIHTTKGEVCQQRMKCMDAITPEKVLAAFERLRRRYA